MVYKPTTDVLALKAEQFGQWTKNNSTIVQRDNFLIGSNKEKKRFWLKIKIVHIYDSGLYSFKVNGSVVRQWELQVRKGNVYLKMYVKDLESASFILGESVIFCCAVLS